MSAKIQMGAFLAVLAMGAGLVACTTSDAKPGDGGSASGGRTGGGTGGTAAAVVACGVGNLPPTPGVLCLPPSQMITDFTYDPDAGATDQVRFGVVGTTFSGGESTYANAPSPPPISDVTQGDWHITINVQNFAGFNLYFDNANGCNMLDASAYDGIQFTIWGTTGGNSITMGVGILDNSVTQSWLDSVDGGVPAVGPGSCMPTTGVNRYYHPGCGDPTNVFAVTGTQAAPQTVSLRWTDFINGMCRPNVLPNQILSVYWQLPWNPPAAAYDVDLHIDNLAFIPK